MQPANFGESGFPIRSSAALRISHRARLSGPLRGRISDVCEFRGETVVRHRETSDNPTDSCRKMGIPARRGVSDKNVQPTIPSQDKGKLPLSIRILQDRSSL